MARPVTDTLTEREAQIMQVIWTLGEATAEQVRAALPHAPHDSTVRTLLRILESKGYVAHETRGKAYVYAPAVERGSAQRLALRTMLTRFFAGSAQDLVMSLIDDDQLSPADLDALRKHHPTARPAKRRRRP